VSLAAGLRVTRVDVACEALGASDARATIRYVVTGLSDDGDADVRRFDAHFDQTMAHWETAIASALDAA